MEGPTPVSALIHAATMVDCGGRLSSARGRELAHLRRSASSRSSFARSGAPHRVLSAAIALTQTDLGVVLAYSTVSQLGFADVLGSGVGGAMRLAVVAAMFHLFTHAFFKALLFLASGSVMHAERHRWLINGWAAFAA